MPANWTNTAVPTLILFCQILKIAGAQHNDKDGITVGGFVLFVPAFFVGFSTLTCLLSWTCLVTAHGGNICALELSLLESHGAVLAFLVLENKYDNIALVPFALDLSLIVLTVFSILYACVQEESQ